MITKNKILLYFFAFLVAAFAFGYYFYNKGPEDLGTSKAVQVTAEDLYQAYLADPGVAQKTYTGKVLLVTGSIARIDKNQQNQTIALLNTREKNAYINCSLESPAPGLAINSKVKLRGLCSGIGQDDADLGLKPDVYLARCLLEK
jgi:hypothetical protein